MKLSQYNVYGRKVRLSGADQDTLHLPVLNTRSGKILLVRHAYVEALRLGNHAQIPHEVMTGLRECGILVKRDSDEVGSVLDENASAAGASKVKTFVLMPTSYCNMACRYCGQSHSPGQQDRSHRDAVKQRIRDSISSGLYDLLEVKWFGGEPLTGLGTLLEIAESARRAAHASGCQYRSSVVTNGTLLNRPTFRSLYNSAHVRDYEVTVDGLSHDRLRPCKNGLPSRDGILAIIAELLMEPGCEEAHFTVRTNVSEQNRSEAAGFARLAADMGLGHPRVTFYPAPIHHWGVPIEGMQVGRDVYGDVEMEWLRAYAAHGLTTTLVPTARRRVVCVAVNRSAEVIDARGRVFSCTEHPLMPAHERDALGCVTENTSSIRPEGRHDKLGAVVRSTRLPCSACRVLPLCGGSCPKAWEEGRVPCPASRFNIEKKLDLYVESLGL